MFFGYYSFNLTQTFAFVFKMISSMLFYSINSELELIQTAISTFLAPPSIFVSNNDTKDLYYTCLLNVQTAQPLACK